MENADRFLGPQTGADLLHNALQIATELGVVMVGRFDGDILPVVAEVEDYQVVSVEEMAPVREIGVGGKTVAVREQYPNAVRIAVTPYANFGAVIEVDVENRAGNWKFKSHDIPPLFLCGNCAGLWRFVELARRQRTGLLVACRNWWVGLHKACDKCLEIGRKGEARRALLMIVCTVTDLSVADVIRSTSCKTRLNSPAKGLPVCMLSLSSLGHPVSKRQIIS